MIRNAFDYRFATKPLGGSAQLGVMRAGKEVRADVALEAAPDTPRDEIVISSRSPFLGAKIANLRRRWRTNCGSIPRAQGVVILDVATARRRRVSASSAATSSLSVNGEKIAQTRDLDRVADEQQPAVAHHHHARRPADLRGARRMSMRAPKRGGPSLFAAAGLEHDAPRPLADKLRPTQACRSRRPGPSARARRRAHAHAGDALARLADLLGPARHRQDHGGAAAGAGDRPAFRADFGDVLRRRRPQEGVRGRRARGARSGRARCCSSTRSTASTARSRIRSCRSWRTAPSCWSAPPPKTRPSSSTRRCCRARACWCSSRSMPRRSRSCSPRAEEIEGKTLPLDDEARASLIRMADGDGRASLTLAEEVWRAARAGEMFDAAALQDVVQRRAPIYDKIAGRPLQPDLGAAQIGARLRPRRGALLSLPHARCRRGPALSRAPRGAHGGRGYRARRSAGAGDRQRRQGRL